jgi:hypothetical protein
MLKKSIAVVFAIALAMTATVASAQCTIAAYGDAAGTQSLLSPQLDAQGDTFSMYIVMFAEDTAAAASYKVNIPGLGVDVFIFDRIAGPSGTGLILDEPTGTNVALTECVYGFFGFPILVEEYVLQPIVGVYAGGQVSVEANVSQGLTPVYVTCTDIIKSCDAGPALTVNAPVDNEATSFSSIKSLYN